MGSGDHLADRMSDAILAAGWLDGPIAASDLPEARKNLAQLLTETRGYERARVEREIWNEAIEAAAKTVETTEVIVRPAIARRVRALKRSA